MPVRAAIVDRLANLVFASCCVALLGVGAVRYWPAAGSAHAAREQVLPAGTAAPFHVAADGEPHSYVYVFVSSACAPCQDSLPFYARLTRAAARTRAGVLFVGMEPEADISAYLQRGGITEARVAWVPRPSGIPGTPSIVAVDRLGRVTRSWAGRLSEAQEHDVLSLLDQAAGAPVARDVNQLLVRARSQLDGSRHIDDVVALDVEGMETRLDNGPSRITPVVFSLRWPDHLDLRTGQVMHSLNGATYSRRLVDAERYGGPLVDRLMADPQSIKVASEGIHFHLLRLAVTYLARAPAGSVIEDAGVRDFGRLKGEAIGFRSPAHGSLVELVLDPTTAAPLGVVSAMRVLGGPNANTETSWISIPSDYRAVSGVRIPHRFDEWTGDVHSRVELTSVRVTTK
jgi:hypothetical protein